MWLAISRFHEMARKRRLFEASFKARVALDAVRGLKTVSELAALHNVPSVTARYPTTSLQLSAVDMSPPVECGCIDLNSRTAKDCFNRNFRK